MKPINLYRVLLALTFAALMVCATNAQAYTATAYKTGQAVTGQTKQCYYNYAGSTYTLTIKSYELCPLSIEVEV